VEALLFEVQRDLIDLGAAISSGEAEPRLDAWDKVSRFEALIDAVQAEAGPTTRFLIPGVTEADALIHQARAVGRRAERRVVVLQPADAVGGPSGPTPAGADRAVRYLNRFADALFALSVWHRYRAGLFMEKDR